MPQGCVNFSYKICINRITMSKIKILKPKRNANGTYEGEIYKNHNKDLLTLKVDDARIVSVKKHHDDFYLYIKHKTVAKDICDINSEIIATVKNNCKSWFKNTLSDDLIEDYFTSNIIYDKTLGQVIKFKCLNDISELQKDMIANISFTLKTIRFYKQKFVIEWDVDEVEISDSICLLEMGDDADADEEDIPEPLVEDILSIKEHYMSIANDGLERLRQEKAILQDKENSLMRLIEKIKAGNNLSEVSDELDKILQ